MTPTRRALAPVLALACAWGVAPAQPAPSTRTFDPAHTQFRFDVRTRWGQPVGGLFARWDARLLQAEDGQQRVRVALDAASVDVAGSRRYTAMARGPNFFDAARHPRIEFVSEPYTAALLQAGGALRGEVTLHGVRRREVFTVAPATCARPGEDCDVIARGRVSRGAYGLRAYGFAVGDTVQFTLRLRLAPEAA